MTFRSPWCCLAVFAALGLLLWACGHAQAVGRPEPRPPLAVRTAVLRGGSYAGIVVEISPGQRTVTETPLLSVGHPPLPRSVYVYAGKLDRRGRAIFRLQRRCNWPRKSPESSCSARIPLLFARLGPAARWNLRVSQPHCQDVDPRCVASGDRPPLGAHEGPESGRWLEPSWDRAAPIGCATETGSALRAAVR